MKRLVSMLWLTMLVALIGPVLDAASTSLSAQGAAALTAFLQQAVARGDVPGAVVAVVNRDGVVYEEAIGSSSLLRHTAMTKDTLFNIASMTKPVTSVAMMRLVEQGKVKLDDPVGKWVPKFDRPVVLTS